MAENAPLEPSFAEPEVHIASIVVYCVPGSEETLKSRIALVPSAECHAQSGGKLVVTLETDSARRTLDCMDAIRALPDVFDVTLVYQHAEPATAMEQEVEP